MFRTLLLTLSLTLCLPALAQDTRVNRLTAAQAYVDQTLQDIDIAAMVRTMYIPIVDQLEAGGQTVTQSQIDRLDALYQETMTDPLLQIMAGQAEIMADIFTLEEIETLASFYNTPVGRSVMTKLPQLTEAIQPDILTTIQSTIPRMMPEIQSILRTP